MGQERILEKVLPRVLLPTERERGGSSFILPLPSPHSLPEGLGQTKAVTGRLGDGQTPGGTDRQRDRRIHLEERNQHSPRTKLKTQSARRDNRVP